MKFQFPKIVNSFSLSEYTESLNVNVCVWVNPTGKILSDLGETFKAFVDGDGAVGLDAFLKVMSVILSQGEDASTHWTAEELDEMINETIDTDPQFFMWFNNRVLKEIGDHRNGQKKI